MLPVDSFIATNSRLYIYLNESEHNCNKPNVSGFNNIVVRVFSGIDIDDAEQYYGYDGD